MDVQFCRRCSAPVTKTGDHRYECSAGHTIFTNVAPTVGIFFITPDNEVLLSRRGIEPHKGMLDSFGGFVDDGESLEQAAVRELQEELSLSPDEYEPLTYLTSGVAQYPYEDEQYPTVTMYFWSRLRTKRLLEPTDDVAEVVAIPLHKIDFSDLHADDTRAGILKLRHLFLAKEEAVV